ncbi:MAG: hypothetical protein CM15mP120_21460 [Pseudomonadota bacterium]|nr:MAG: hypothetical protein CM15mP120_21460 [Pseudomonadota bacterium]
MCRCRETQSFDGLRKEFSKFPARLSQKGVLRLGEKLTMLGVYDRFSYLGKLTRPKYGTAGLWHFPKNTFGVRGAPGGLGEWPKPDGMLGFSLVPRR